MLINKLLDELMAHSKPSEKQTVKQKRIIEVALSMFAEKGYANTSTAEIAKVAEVAEGTIFKHFGTKENLLLSLIVPYIKNFFPAIADEVIQDVMAEPVTTFEDFLRKFLKNRCQFFLDNREIFQVLVKEMIYREELKNELLPHLFEHVSARFGHIVTIFQERGQLKNVATASFLPMLYTFLGGFFVSRFVILNHTEISEQEIEDAVRFVMAGIGGNS